MLKLSAASRRCDFADDGFATLTVEKSAGDHRRALLREAECGSVADSIRRPRDHYCNFAVESAHRNFLLSLVKT